MELLIYCLSVYFLFFLVNYSLIFDAFRKQIENRSPEWFKTLVSCPLCFCWWFSLVVCFFFTSISLVLFAAPVVNMFLDMIYHKLKK
jgi:hypothetical protein